MTAKAVKTASALILSALVLFGSACLKTEPTASVPTEAPVYTEVVIDSPTPPPTAAPTTEPTEVPTEEPTPEPTPEPTAAPEPTPEGYLTEEEKLRLVNFEYRLEDGYVPHDLVIACQYLKGECGFKYQTTPIQIEVADQLRLMLRAAAEEGVKHKYYLVNAYRDQWTQRRMFQKRLDQNPHYGEDPYHNPVGTMPYNASEHCYGLAIDITSMNYTSVSRGYGATAEAKWMTANAHRFGFILRYPADKEHITGVHYEPWHFRYVGVEAAKEIYERGLCLEEYLGKLPPYMTGLYSPFVTACVLPDNKYFEG